MSRSTVAVQPWTGITANRFRYSQEKRYLQGTVHLLVSVVEDQRTFALKCEFLLLPMRKINEMLVILAQFFDDFLVSFKLSWWMLHRIEDEDSFWNIVVFVSSEPIWEDGVRGSFITSLEFYHFNTIALQLLLKVVKFNLGLKDNESMICSK